MLRGSNQGGDTGSLVSQFAQLFPGWHGKSHLLGVPSPEKTGKLGGLVTLLSPSQRTVTIQKRMEGRWEEGAALVKMVQAQRSLREASAVPVKGQGHLRE